MTRTKDLKVDCKVYKFNEEKTTREKLLNLIPITIIVYIALTSIVFFTRQFGVELPNVSWYFTPYDYESLNVNKIFIYELANAGLWVLYIALSPLMFIGRHLANLTINLVQLVI